MGQNIGTCATALLSSMGTTKNAKRAAVVHLAFNVLGTLICLIIFILASKIIQPLILNDNATHLSIALSHTAFNIVCTAIMLPLSSFLEKIAIKLVPDSKGEESFAELAKTNSADGSASNGGLYTDVTEGYMVQTFNDWIMDASTRRDLQ